MTEICIIYIVNTCSNCDFRSLASSSKLLKICSSSASCKADIKAVKTDLSNISMKITVTIVVWICKVSLCVGGTMSMTTLPDPLVVFLLCFVGTALLVAS